MTGYMCGCRFKPVFILTKNNVFISNGMASLSFNLFIQWWHEKQPLKCFRHSLFLLFVGIFPFGREISYVCIVFVCIFDSHVSTIGNVDVRVRTWRVNVVETTTFFMGEKIVIIWQRHTYFPKWKCVTHVKASSYHHYWNIYHSLT